ncbi:SepM family pheromone-processing serine protease [Alkalihalophilus marmarensis]|uniref:SepM family pheromone-processing serine protease n=1 Tax=Alkalihalophilus marmarensis TaxID=521377 RepID=UPI002DB7A670|nr:SepM family pheromone-processing serine protease [Alkalihalophilus marmarensis]MEC2072989.1 SepM family pheromone-processing serine protease [Alkalihalophilus marmarensis]
MKQTKQSNWIKWRWPILIILLLGLYFTPLPYYYSQPGDALVLDDVISVDGASEEAGGSFMLTTIRMGKANPIFYAWAQFSPYRILHPESQLRFEDETDEEYQHRQLMMMTDSQEVAKIVAYEQANKEVSYEYFGVLVTVLIEGMPAIEVLEQGDRIQQVNGESIRTADELIERLTGYEKGDNVTLTIEREGELMEVTVGFSHFPEEMNAPSDRVGIGIQAPVTDREVTFNPEVHIDTSQIGGPSAGLMFSLEIYDQLTEGNLTKGYLVAGTGTIREDGTVGRIGGAAQKVVAADRAGADYFLAPFEDGADDSNYNEAVLAAEDIGTDMEIIPINRFEEAIEFLESL